MAKFATVPLVTAVVVDDVDEDVVAIFPTIEEVVEPDDAVVVMEVPDRTVAAPAAATHNIAIPAPKMEPVDLEDILQPPTYINVV
ncbi:hypothetical protein [Sphingobium sp.]|uniref:hypothetical protein n=1 Tax=Sphingobium sp. TaxID=1912891 RepID=UPI0035C6B1F8